MHLSVIIPAHNEEKRIVATLKSVSEYLASQNYGYEIILVDNQSTDSTVDVVKELFASEVSNGHLIQVAVKGKGSTVRAGMESATGDYAMFMDADNATPISEIEKFWSFFEQGYSVIIGSRYLPQSQVTHKQPFYRIVLSRLSNLLIQLVAVPGIKDTQLGFKVFTKQAAKNIFKHVSISGWGFDMEVLTVANVQGYKIKEVPVLWREFGGSHVPLTAYFQSLRDLARIKIRALSGKYNKNSGEAEA